MKIVHTADIHLSPNHPERLNALEKVVELCEKEEADLLLVTGDLFDANIDLEELKTDLRPLFSDNSFQTLVIPGNHDKSAFRQEDYLGEDLEVLQDGLYSKKIFEDVNIVGLPYTNKDFSEMVEPLSNAVEEDKKNILMIHCTLAGATGGFGDESEYLPVKPSELVQTGFEYVLAGHIHSSPTRKSFGDTVFAYPGSPVSISSSEIGKRKVWLLDTGQGLETRELDTKYFLKEKKEVLPGEEEEVKEAIENNFEGRDLEKASIILEIEGFTQEKVQELSKELKKEVEGFEPLEVNVKKLNLESADSIMGSEIYNEFKRKMEDKDFEKPDLVEKKFLRGLSRNER